MLTPAPSWWLIGAWHQRAASRPPEQGSKSCSEFYPLFFRDLCYNSGKGENMGFLDKKEDQQRRALIITGAAVVGFLLILVVAVVTSVTGRNNATPTVSTETVAEVSADENAATGGGTNSTDAESSAVSSDAESSTESSSSSSTSNAATTAGAESVPDTGPESLLVVGLLAGAATTLAGINWNLRRELATRAK